jgi:hypothetical protein
VFLAIYITEAHAKDEWPVGKTTSFCDQPKTNEERMKLAKMTTEKCGFSFPFLVDTIENHFENAYSSWPFRFYGFKNGKLDYKPTPDLLPRFAYDVSKLGEWLDQI